MFVFMVVCGLAFLVLGVVWWHGKVILGGFLAVRSVTPLVLAHQPHLLLFYRTKLK